MSIQELSKSLVADVKAILEGKKLDPVGKADADIDLSLIHISEPTRPY